ncbi:MAG: hypothetical protein WD021_01075 [Rhodothermales bacterium]
MTDPNMPDPLRDLPDEARIWVYAADRDLNDLQEKRVAEILNDFCASWMSHGRPVESAADVLEGRFAVIAGRIVEGDISGCGIDASVHALEKASNELPFDWSPALTVHYRDENGGIRSVSRSDFRSLVRSGDVGPDTRVFDLNIQSLADLREDKFEQAAANTWHARAFRLAEPAT